MMFHEQSARPGYGMPRRRFLRALGGAACAAMGAYGYGSRVEAFNLRVERVTLGIPGLAARWDGVRIVQLSDLHACGRTDLRHIGRALGMAADLEPAYLLITGDWVCDHLRGFPAFEEILRPVAQRAAIIGSLGNHDYGDNHGRERIDKELVERLRNLGVRMLIDQHYQPFAGGGEVCFLGLHDLWSGRFCAAPFDRVPKDATVLLLSHNPDTADELAGCPWQAMFSGHTHGGEIVIPGWGPVILPVKNRAHHAGLYAVTGPAGPRHLYVNRGIGYSLGMRLFCPPEVTCFTLRGA